MHNRKNMYESDEFNPALTTVILHLKALSGGRDVH